MNDKLYLSLISMFTMSILILVQIISLNSSKRDIFLGVRIPQNERNSDELKKLGKRYIVSNLFIGIPVAIIFSVLVYNSIHVWLFVVLLFTFIFINFLVYYRYNRIVLKLKSEKGWLKTKKQFVVIDTNFTKENYSKIMPSTWWFSISFLIIAACIIINIIQYPKLPYKFPTHWGFNGEPDGYSIKSYSSIFSMPVVQLFMLVVMFFSYKTIGWSKREINPKNPEESKIRSIKFKRIWGIYLIIINYVMQILLVIGDLQTMQIINPNMKFTLFFILIVFFGVTAGSVVLSIKVGQGGSKLKINKESKIYDVDIRDDDKFWKLGNTIYYNKDDPSVFVEKRFGIGWTVNAATTLGTIFYIFIIVILICSLIPLFFIR
ncbi:DUF1648 domain-containing protein [Clostridium guangxiense]|uniref:DUF1648 domain-containing protein n=1 Tax=Clostridium guangxiense TaxID=1662055 RepID=UPI001E284F8F|nr:DUF1648 domain-containing protein [Clostridium guangxiense]MCD2347608.1 DUF1648 domain-containing protein [Clostridium guangxiense]